MGLISESGTLPANAGTSRGHNEVDSGSVENQEPTVTITNNQCQDEGLSLG